MTGHGPTRAEEPMSRTRPLIVVIEDDGDIRALLRTILEASGCDVRTASSGADGIALVDDLLPDAITLDVSMPVMDGFETATEIRTRHTIPILMISARADERALSRARDIGVDAFVTKPFRPRDLRQQLTALLDA